MKSGNEKLAAGNGHGVVDLIVATIYGEGRGGVYGEDEGLANEMLGLPKENLEEVVGKLIKG